jgi:hypothetical protein
MTYLGPKPTYLPIYLSLITYPFSLGLNVNSNAYLLKAYLHIDLNAMC